MSELFLFVRPPRAAWPFNGPGSAFWPPLAFASLAGALRQALPDVRVAILDAPILAMGWDGLAADLHRLQPAYVGIGEEAVSCREGLRLAQLAKATGARVIAGGCFFSHLAADLLKTRWIDVVVHGEGERTIVELVQALRSHAKADLARVAGISFLDGEAVVRTAPRPLIEDLDRLPMPAYDLLPFERYGRTSRNHPRLAAIEFSRGCTGSCAFCVLWRQMGRFEGNRLVPCLRVKTPERLLEETRILVHRFGRRYLGWVDPCFNADPTVPARLAEALLRENLRVGQSAWVRAEGVARDAASGALAACVRAGLNEVYLGIERGDSASLGCLDKPMNLDDARTALELLARQFPRVFTVGSFIYGLPDDTPQSVRALCRFALDLPLDKAFFIPLTPLPGTPYWRPEFWDPTGQRFRQFDFLPGAHGNHHAQDLERALLKALALDWTWARVRGYWRSVTRGGARKRRMTCRLFARSVGFVGRRILESVWNTTTTLQKS